MFLLNNNTKTLNIEKYLNLQYKMFLLNKCLKEQIEKFINIYNTKCSY